MFKAFTKEQFIEFSKVTQIPEFVDLDFLYDVYIAAADGIKELHENNIISNSRGLSSFDLINYAVGEYLYNYQIVKKENFEKIKNNPETINLYASIVADKFISLSVLNKKEDKFTNKYFPPISSLNLYLNFLHNVVGLVNKNDPKSSLIYDLLIKSISLCRCITNLLVEGYETEALSSWRTLHECECVLVILEKYPKEAIPEYLKFMRYGFAYKEGYNGDKDKQDVIFEEIKSAMKKLDLKSKDMKKYIEYGWLYACPKTNDIDNFALNFRDGLERVAELDMYYERYSLSSEIVHSTPLLIYSSKEYFYYLTLLSVYESFFRIERVFVSLYKNYVTKDQMEQYINMRNLYYNSLMNIYKFESQKFEHIQQKKEA